MGIRCQLCDDTGFQHNLETGKSWPCSKCHQQRKVVNLANRARISPDWRACIQYPPSFFPSFRMYAGIRAESFIKDPVVFLESIIAAMPEKHRGIYLYGLPGRGKTHIAYTITLECIKRYGWSCFTITESKLNNLVFDRTPVDDMDNDIHVLADRVENSRLLLIDEMGSEPLDSKGYKDNWMNRLIRLRNDRGLTTLFTSNLSLGDMRERYGDRICSFMLQICTFVKFTSKDDFRLMVQEQLSRELNDFFAEGENHGSDNDQGEDDPM